MRLVTYRQWLLIVFAVVVCFAVNNIRKVHHMNPREVEINSNGNDKFITYKILRNLPFFGETCTRYGNLTYHKPFTLPGVVDFHARVRTNLNILYVGSSVGAQFAQSFEEEAMSQKREVIRYAWSRYHENTFVSLTPDNGTISFLRITGLLLNDKKNRPKLMAPDAGGGWLEYDVREMKRLVHTWRHVDSIDGRGGKPTSPCEEKKGSNTNLTYPCDQKNFDVVVHQLAAEWNQNKPFDKGLTRKDLHEIMDISFNYLGAKTVILQTIPITNNAQAMSEIVTLNRLIWEYSRELQMNIAKSRNSNNSSNGNNLAKPWRRILVMDVYSYSVSLYLQNCIEIGFIERERGEKLQSELLRSPDVFAYNMNLTSSLNETFDHKIPVSRANKGRVFIKIDGKIIYKKKGQICGDMNCTTKSVVSRDGVHWCMRETGGRLSAGLACLIRCSLKNEGLLAEQNGCQKRCNARYMSLVPVPWDNGKEFDVNGTNMIGLQNW